jgi:hypothetical protein
LFEKPTAVRAFCTATSQLKNVASPVRNVPSTVGPIAGSFGKFTTVMKTCIGTPMGSRIPARVVRALSAAKSMMAATSAAVRRGWPLIVPGSGSLMIGCRISPCTPPNVASGYGNGGGVPMTGKPGAGAPCIKVPLTRSGVGDKTYGTAMPLM